MRDMHIYILDNTAVAAYAKTYTAKENGNVAHEDTTRIFTKNHGVSEAENLPGDDSPGRAEVVLGPPSLKKPKETS
jgi:hypothetical protein